MFWAVDFNGPDSIFLPWMAAKLASYHHSSFGPIIKIVRRSVDANNTFSRLDKIDDAIDEFMPFMHEVQKSGGFPKIADGEHVSWHRAVKKYAKKSRLKYSRTIVKDDGSIYVDEVGG